MHGPDSGIMLLSIVLILSPFRGESLREGAYFTGLGQARNGETEQI